MEPLVREFAWEIVWTITGLGTGAMISWLFHKKEWADHQRQLDDLKNKIDSQEKLSLLALAGRPPAALENLNCKFDPETATLTFGTDYGNLEVRLHDGRTVSRDISKWIHRKGLVAPIEGEDWDTPDDAS